jgi:hypothetical protein
MERDEWGVWSIELPDGRLPVGCCGLRGLWVHCRRVLWVCGCIAAESCGSVGALPQSRVGLYVGDVVGMTGD